METERSKGENTILQERKHKKSLLVGGSDSPAKEFPLLKALYMSLCKPYHALRMSHPQCVISASQECRAVCVCSAVPLIKVKPLIPIP